MSICIFVYCAKFEYKVLESCPFQVLKALALLRMGRLPEGSSLLSAIHSSQPTDEQTLSAMAICYKETQQCKCFRDGSQY